MYKYMCVCTYTNTDRKAPTTALTWAPVLHKHSEVCSYGGLSIYLFCSGIETGRKVQLNPFLSPPDEGVSHTYIVCIYIHIAE